jgi:hypothetical protein
MLAWRMTLRLSTPATTNSARSGEQPREPDRAAQIMPMTPGETARTVIAMLEADLRGELDEAAFVSLVGDDVSVEAMTSMFGCAVQLFSALAEQHPLDADHVLEGHRRVSFGMDDTAT